MFLLYLFQAELLDPALKGTLNVLKSCVNSPTLKRVVLTSSIAAVANKESPNKTPDVVVDETWFSDPEFLRRTEGWYDLSKTLAEEAAWKFAKENNIDLVTINPALVTGPLLQPVLNTSAAAVLNFVNGNYYFYIIIYALNFLLFPFSASSFHNLIFFFNSNYVMGHFQLKLCYDF